jgi:hypothetical protein
VSDELEPCPWCGSDEHLSTNSVGVLTADMPDRPYRVVCHNIEHDNVCGPVAYGARAAIEAWNTRALASSPRIEALEEAARLYEALKALMPGLLCGESWNLPDDEGVSILVTFGNLKAAREVIASYEANLKSLPTRGEE